MKNDEIIKVLNDETISLDDRFWMASVLVDALKPLNLISLAEMRTFYGPYKQAIFGPCTDPVPSYSDLAGRLKWNSWNELGDMSREDAQEKYLSIALEDVFERIKEIEEVVAVCDKFTLESLKKMGGEKKVVLEAEVKKKNEQKKIDAEAAASKEPSKGYLAGFQATIQAPFQYLGTLVYKPQPSSDKPGAGAEVSDLKLEKSSKGSGVKV